MWTTTSIKLGILTDPTNFKIHGYPNTEGVAKHAVARESTVSEMPVLSQKTNVPKSKNNAVVNEDHVDQTDKPIPAGPLNFIQGWLASVPHTPVGYVRQGKRLTAGHPFFAKPETNDVHVRPIMARAINGTQEDRYLEGFETTEDELPEQPLHAVDSESDTEDDDEADDGYGGGPGRSPPEEEESSSSSSEEEESYSEEEDMSDEDVRSEWHADTDDES